MFIEMNKNSITKTTLLYINGFIIKQKDNKIRNRAEQYYRANILNRYIWDIPYNCSQTGLSNYIWNIQIFKHLITLNLTELTPNME